MGPRSGFGFDPLNCESRFAIALGEPALNGVEPAFGVLGSPCPFGQAAQLGLKRQVRVVLAPSLKVVGIQPDHTGLKGVGLGRARGATTIRARRGIVFLSFFCPCPCPCPCPLVNVTCIVTLDVMLPVALRIGFTPTALTFLRRSARALPPGEFVLPALT